MNRSKIKVIFGVSITIILLMVIYPKINRAIEIDSCLDSGGRWNYKQEKCDRVLPTIKIEEVYSDKNSILDENIIYKSSVGSIKIGLPISVFKKYIEKSNKTIKVEAINLEGNDYKVYSVYDNDILLYKVEPDCNTKCYVWRIWISNKSIKTEKGIGIGSNLESILKSYEIDYLSTEEGIVIVPMNKNFSFSLVTDKLSSEWWSNPTIDKLDKNKTIVSEIIITK